MIFQNFVRKSFFIFSGILFLYQCGNSFEPNNLYGSWVPKSIDCGSPELSEEVKQSGIKLNLEKGVEGEYGKISGLFPMNDEIKEIQSSFTAKYDKDIDKMEIIFKMNEFNESKLMVHSLSSSEMLTGGTFKSSYCKIILQK